MLTLSAPVRAEARRCLAHCRAPRVRTLTQFVQDEIVLPEGPFAGRRFRFRRQPYARLAYEAIDSGRWARFAFPGCVQSGKSLHFWVIPILYHAAEIGENVVVGLPDMQLAHTKWREEVEPIFRRSSYAWLLPDTGRGSRGGDFDELKLRNGATIKFMSGHGGDAKRSSFTARVVVATEVDKYDRPTATSREADPITQMQDRADAWKFWDRRVYLECTVSIEEGRIWQEYQNGTTSQIAVQCPHCRQYITPEREHLVGWQQAESDVAAYNAAYWACPACAEPLPESDRPAMLSAAKLVHRGQEIDPDGNIHGEAPETATLGFRWSAYDNLFWTPGDVAIKEWHAARSDDESKERELLQFYHVLPHQPPQLKLISLDPQKLKDKKSFHPHGVVPADAEHFAMGIDTGKWKCYFQAIGWREGASGNVVDYNELLVPSAQMDVELAILSTLRQFRDDTINQGWIAAGGLSILPEVVLIDARYQGDHPGSEAVYEFCRESGPRFLPLLGYGQGKRYVARYREPKKLDRVVRHIGVQYHIAWSQKHRTFVVHANVDYWKGWLQRRLETPAGQAGSIELYASPNRNEHLGICRAYASEEPYEEFIPGVGVVTCYKQVYKNNHQLDTAVYASIAGHFAGVRLVDDPPPPPPPDPLPDTSIRTPDGRAYLASDR